MTNLADASSTRHPSRRTVLRAGAVVGTVAWTAPIIQAVGMSPAHADSLSGAAPSDPQVPVSAPTTVPNGPTTVANGPIDGPGAPVTAPGDPATLQGAHAAVQGAPTTRTKTAASGLATTGVSAPVLPTVAVGVAAIVVGGAIVAAAERLGEAGGPARAAGS